MAVLGVDGWRGAWVGARLDGRTTNLADVLDDDGIDSLIVDGREVQPGQVIVLRQVRDDPKRSTRRA